MLAVAAFLMAADSGAALAQKANAPHIAVDIEPSPVLVQVSVGGAVTVDGETVGRDELEARFAGIAAKTPQPPVLIIGDGKVAYGDMAYVLAAARRAGLTRKMGIVGGT